MPGSIDGQAGYWLLFRGYAEGIAL
ncbi:hypothetical protein AE23_05145, partial [Klebsiella pneumoniae UCI 64]